jgi:hypothetical protein
MALTSTDWAYLAGLIDGEGSIGTTRTGKRGDIVGRLIIANTNHDFLRMLQARFGGGSLNLKKAGQKEGWRPYGNIAWTQLQARKLLEATLPYLFIKRRQAELCLDLMRMRDWPKGKRYFLKYGPSARQISPFLVVRSEVRALEEQIAASIRELNRKGVISSPDSPFVPATDRLPAPEPKISLPDLFSIRNEGSLS